MGHKLCVCILCVKIVLTHFVEIDHVELGVGAGGLLGPTSICLLYKQLLTKFS